MKKTKTLAKRILSVALATMIVLSFALISVSALPADYTQVGTNGEFIDFENGTMPHISSEGTTTLSVTDKYAHSGTKSLAVTDPGDGHAKFYYSNGVKFEPNSTYYVSFWYYTDKEWNNNFGGTDAASGLTFGTMKASSTTNGQWNKVWYTITTGATVGNQYFRPQFYNIGKERTVYVDDFEVRQIVSAEGLTNTIPEGTTATNIALAYGENVTLSADQLANGTDSGDTIEKTVEYAHWSEQSYKFVANYKVTNTTGDTGIYTSLNNDKFFGSGATLKANTPYYISYYVYCPTKTVSTRFIYFSGAAIINRQIVPQGQWTKVSALFTPDEATATAANSQLLKLWIRDTKDADGVNHPVYLDDLVIAELESEPMIAFTQSNIDFYDNGDALVTLTSSMELKGVDYTKITGATVTSKAIARSVNSAVGFMTGVDATTSEPTWGE